MAGRRHLAARNLAARHLAALPRQGKCRNVGAVASCSDVKLDVSCRSFSVEDGGRGQVMEIIDVRGERTGSLCGVMWRGALVNEVFVYRSAASLPFSGNF